MNFKALAVFALAALIPVPQVFGFYETYRAAVVEFHFNEREQTSDIVTRYEALIKKAKEEEAEIIVFPEGGLADKKLPSPVPDPVKGVIPCDSQSQFVTTEMVKKLSCAAKSNKIYTVVNLREKRVCNIDEDEDCPPSGHYLLNTNVAFDRKGAVVLRYSKFNLFDEKDTHKLANVELGFFDTDFGVRFGTFICFDILFRDPTLRLIEQFGITDFVFPTFWFSELPFLSALQVQKGWAESNNVNLLASGVNFPSSGSGGSGIYNGKYGAAVAEMPEKSVTKLLVATVPVIKEKGFCAVNSSQNQRALTSLPKVYAFDKDEKEESFKFLRDQFFLFNSEVIESDKTFDRQICSRNGFCCDFQVYIKKISKNSTEYVYRAVVSDGVRKFGLTATGGIQACGVVVCVGPFLADCGYRAKNFTNIYQVTQINIQGNFLRNNVVQFPSTLAGDTKIRPLDENKYEFRKVDSDAMRKVSLKLLWTIKDLQTFGIWGRDFSRDGDPQTVVVSRANFVLSTPLVLFTSFAFFFIRNLTPNTRIQFSFY